ncbi:helix-turn-helix domain-containing protein [Candidatus Bathyarchaeota archaeon]|nr:helix-turn-helix domain-containing protein [Candidatus Bathyarchaeota archaeon]
MENINSELVKSGIIMLHPIRLKILRILEEKGEMYIEPIAEGTGVDRRLISFHLGVLQNNGFLKSAFKVVEEPHSKGKAGRFFNLTPKYEETKSKLSDFLKR